jgi:Xaa-Pro aminopeptidase
VAEQAGRSTALSSDAERLCNPLPLSELQRRWAAVRAAMPALGIDALVVQGACNLAGIGGTYRWLTGLSAASSYSQTVIFPHAGLMTQVAHGPLDGDTRHDGNDLAMPGIGRRLSTSAFPGVAYTGTYEPDIVAREIKQSGFKTVGLVAANSMYHGFASRLIQQLDGVRIVDATDMVDRIKAIKSPVEIDLIRRAAAMQDEIFEKTLEHIRPGLKEYEVMAYSHYLGQKLGSETGYFLGSSAPAGQPAGFRLRPQQGRELRKGDVFLWQAENTGPGGYFTHLARIVVLGKAPPDLIDGFNKVAAAQEFTASLLKPGASCRDIFAKYNDYMHANGLAPETRLHCHSQGYDAVERPLIRHDETMTLAGNMNIGIHPSFGNPRMFMTVCDNFLLHEDGAVERLSKTPHRIYEI